MRILARTGSGRLAIFVEARSALRG